MKRVVNILGIFLFFAFADADAQGLSNLHIRYLSMASDTIQVDTLSIVPGSVQIHYQGSGMDSTLYEINEAAGKLIWKKQDRNKVDSVEIRYRTFPILFTATNQIRDRKLMEKGSKDSKNPFLTETPTSSMQNIFGLEGLNKSGSISRGITIGNNQDAVINSSLNLQLSGRLSGNVDILAAITDDNIPIQTDGNTQQLQEFDKVFIQLSNPNHKLIAGDFEVKNPDGYFMRYFKKGQGGLYDYNGMVKNKDKEIGALSLTAGAAVSKGKIARNTFNGIESNQGPYRLRGAENESYIVILSGTEKIYLDGMILDRGQDRDYIIDYNTAEITFTTKRIITRDTRIVAEFQYSDKNYARTMLISDVGWQQKKLKASINIYSEQDSKNQPLQQDLSDADKLILAQAGDNLSQAYAPNVDSVIFSPSEILYKKIDTLVNAVTYSVYLYSTNPDSAKYRVGFSNVGTGIGNYIVEDGLANGRVYRWVAPVNGIPQGTYEPQVQLISPKQRQMVTANVEYSLTPGTNIGIELAGSKDDLNRFSSLDKDNDKGGAARLTIEKNQPLKRDTSNGWMFTSSLQTEFTDKNFKPVENYRPIEFTRDWNTFSITTPGNEFFSSVQVGLRNPIKGDVHYAFRSYLHDTQYKGFMNILGGQWKWKKLTAVADGSYLATSGTSIKSSYLRHREEVNYHVKSWTPGIHIEQERNEISIPGADSIAAGSFSFRLGEVYLQRADTTKVPMKISVSRRYDDGIQNNSFNEASVADMASFGASWISEKQRLTGQVNYRNLQITDSTITAARNEESVGGRFDYSINVWKDAIQFNTYYEGGTGQEPRKLYSYIAVATGTGTYTWNDYNGDGIPQLNEFEVATFQDQANYIRIFTPTEDYVKVFFNQFNAVITFSPDRLFKSSEKHPLWTRFSIQSSVRFDNRVANEKGIEGWNPFPRTIADTALLSTQSSSRHTLFFNRTNPSLGAELSYQDQQSRQLLSNGIEARSNQIINGLFRMNITKWIGVKTVLENGNKQSISEAFHARDFTIRSYSAEQGINFQPGTTYRFNITYRYENKKNIIAEGFGEKALVQDAGIEWRYSSVKRGIVSAKFNVVDITYDADPNTSIAYEMLEGLKIGTNLTWGFSLQRNLGNSLQVSINYDGRKPAGVKVIHTGGAQVRAYF